MAQRRFHPFFLGFCFWSAGVLFWASVLPAAQDDAADAVSYARGLSLAFRRAAESAMPSVVTVIAKTKPSANDLRRLLDDPRFRRLFPQESPGESRDGQKLPEHPLVPQVGSGVIIDAAGVILTNNHVVQEAEEVIVRLPDGQELTATEVKTDPLSDLAIVRIKPAAGQQLRAARLGDSEALKIGDWVIAIGSPFELEATVSAGIISGKGRDVEKVRRGRLLQTDAAINPGNSGGPLVNLDGEVIGINTAIASLSGGNQGVGFAIPTDRAKWISQELLTRGQVRRAYLGIDIDDLTAESAAKLKVPPRSGALVLDIVAGSPADEAGVKVNDVITEFAGQRVRGRRDLQDAVEQKPIDSKQVLKIMRDGAAVTATVTLKELPESSLKSRP